MPEPANPRENEQKNPENKSKNISKENLKKSASKLNLVQIVSPYRWQILLLLILTIASNGFSLAIPRLIGQVIDSYTNKDLFEPGKTVFNLGLVAFLVAVLTFAQAALSAFTAEKMAFDLRQKLAQKISTQTFDYVNNLGSGRLLTNLTSDVDKSKLLISQGLVTAVSAVFILLGSSILLLSINWRLALIALSVVPLIALTFALIFKQIGNFFKLAQENLEKINGVINESILGAMLIRVLNSQQSELKKFAKVNEESRRIRLQIVYLFSSLIPSITFLSNLATLAILYFGGRQVIEGTLTLGEFSAFFSYLSLLIFPIFMLGFIGSILSSATTSLNRIQEVLDSKVEAHRGQIDRAISGSLRLENISLELDNQSILRQVSFTIFPRTRTAILGPTAAGKTQIFNLIAGLRKPTDGTIWLDGEKIEDWDRGSFYAQVGLVFQDSVIFNTTLRENIFFRNSTDSLTQNQNIENEKIDKILETTALKSFVQTLPDGLETQIEERGSNLSGGQKQRLMLARALALDPKILLLDDFTARVDIQTEKHILTSLQKNYPDLTLLSITQKIEPIRDYDKIIVIMEGELIAVGRHQELLQTSLEYQQIWQSQQSVED